MNVAFIPVRGGSKSIHLKNIKIICGKPLVYWACKAACESGKIDVVYVATDSDIIRETVDGFILEEPELFSKISVINRSVQSATDSASTECAMLEFATQYTFDNIILIQATSPLLTNEDIDRGFIEFGKKDTESVLSVVRQKRFIWSINNQGFASSENYDVYNRPRRQNFDGYFVENGAFYITSKKALLKSQNRVSGNIRLVEMQEESYFEIDEPNDFIIIESILHSHNKENRNIQHIKMLLTDCDGCLTDGGMYYSEQGDELKKFNTRDGVAFSLLHERGILTGMITGETVLLNKRRADKVKIDFYKPGCKNKMDAVISLCKENSILPQEVLYIGDELNDLDVMNYVGYSCCPSDACEEVKNASDYITKCRGGGGVIREIVRMILGIY